MPNQEDLAVIEDDSSELKDAPEVVVQGDEAIIHIKGPEQVETRKVKLPKTTWG